MSGSSDIAHNVGLTPHLTRVKDDCCIDPHQRVQGLMVHNKRSRGGSERLWLM